jgi:hypothetical protein
VRTPESSLVPALPGWSGEPGEALGECTGCAAVTAYDPEAMAPGSTLLCRPCGLAALGLAGF